MDNKKIVFLVNDITISGGLERVVANLANIFSDKGLDVEIISLHKEKKELFYNLNKEIKLEFFSKLPQPRNRKKRAILKFLKYLKLYKKIFFKKNIVLIGTDYYFNILISLLPKNSMRKIIGSEHLNYEHAPKLLNKIRLRCYKKLDKLVVVNNSDKKKFGELLNNVVCIYNPLTYRSSITSELINKELIAVGRLSEEKNFLELVEIMKDIFKIFPEWKIKIFGEGELREVIDSKINEYRLQKNIILKGVSKYLEKEYLKSSILISVSKRESYSLAIAEAQSFGIPVIAYDCPVGPREIINNNIDGILIPMNERDEFISELKKLMADTDYRKKIGKASKINSNRFSREKIFEEWQEIL